MNVDSALERPSKIPQTTIAMHSGLSGENVICFAGEDWWYHHPHTENRLMRRLAKHNKVLFVNSLTMGLPSASNPDFFLKIRRKLKSYVKWLKKAPEGLWVMTPINLPLYGSKWGRRVNWLLLVLQLRLVMLLLGLRKPVVYACIPTAADLIGHLNEKAVVYQVSDKLDANEDSALSVDVIRELDSSLKQRSDVVMYTGKRLFDEATEPHRYYFEQGVDYGHFANLPAQTPADAANIPKPILGYFGAMDFVMDTELIAEVAKRRPEWHWLLIGNKSNLIQISGPNLHFLGSKPLAALPAYVNCFDVCVLPWHAANEFVSYGSAMKVREYLATGKPTVIAPLYEYLKTPGLHIYRSIDEFIAFVERSLRNDAPADRERRQSAVRNGTWDDRTRELGEVIQSILQSRNCFSGPRPCDVHQNT